MKRLCRLFVADDGVTVTELMVVSLIMAFTMASVGGLMSGFLRDWHIQSALAAVERDSRPVVRDMLIEIRQSIAPLDSAGSHPVSEVAWDRLVFYSDRLGDTYDSPEMHVYELINCTLGGAGGLCDLQLSIYEADNPADLANWTYTTTTPVVDIVLSNVLAEPPTDDDGNPNVWLASEIDDSLFHLVRWDTTGTTTEVLVGECDDAGSTLCEANLVVMNLRIDPTTVKDNPAIYELHEEVRLRNA